MAELNGDDLWANADFRWAWAVLIVIGLLLAGFALWHPDEMELLACIGGLVLGAGLGGWAMDP